MKISTYKKFAVGLALLVGVASCDSPKRYAYLQNVELAKQYAVAYDQQATVSVGDRLSIAVGSAFPELAAPFNGGGFSSGGIGALGGGGVSNVSAGSEQQGREQQALGYLVGVDGTINFPVLGKVSVAGKSILEIRTLLTDLIIQSKYVTDPRVEVMLSNYTIYLLGAIGNETVGQGYSSEMSMYNRLSSLQGGRLRIFDKERVNIFEALSMAGDLPANARISRVNVIRNEGGKYVSYRLDMKSTSIYDSPGFYLKNNDIVYVEPSYRKTETIDRAIQLTSYFLSTISSTVAVVVLVNNATRK
ncbi:MAG: polysaccharide biosynthesis/export family protein [Porphyromonadaceae bacterium]|nr:polysaccharide biosynthesis/export family protein [Porphyromonadaceae bacterium]